MTPRQVALALVAVGAVGSVLVVVGVSLVYPPAAVILAGAFLCGVSAAGLRRELPR